MFAFTNFSPKSFANVWTFFSRKYVFSKHCRSDLSMRSCPRRSVRPTCPDWPVSALQSHLSCPRCAVPTTLSYYPSKVVLSVQVVLALLSCPCCHVLAILSSLYSLGCIIQVLFDCPAPDVMSQHSCPVPAVCPFWPAQGDLSGWLFPDRFVSAVLSLLSWPRCPVPTDLSWLTCPCCHGVAVQSSLSCSVCNILTVWLSCLGCPVQAVQPWLSFTVSVPAVAAVLTLLPCLTGLSSLSCPKLSCQADLSRLTYLAVLSRGWSGPVILFQMSCPPCPCCYVWPSCPLLPVAAVLYCQWWASYFYKVAELLYFRYL
jgi:hypothetical protein